MDLTGGNTTSFIPKKPLVAKGDFTASFGGIFMALSIVLFIISVSGYFVASYQKKTKKEDIEFLTDNLQKAQAQFQPNQVLNMTRFDTKLQVAQDLLYLNKNAGFADTTMHITLQPLFKILSDKTLTSVRFKDFKYTNVDNQKIDIKMSGEARGKASTANYAAVAQQAREFADTRSLMNVIVSDLNLGSNNNVIFNLSASVKPELISYTESLKQ
jgi:hypothetical protein